MTGTQPAVWPADPRDTPLDTPIDTPSLADHPSDEQGCVILLSPFPLEDSNGRAPEIRNPFCSNDLGSTETQRNRRQAMPGTRVAPSLTQTRQSHAGARFNRRRQQG